MKITHYLSRINLADGGVVRAVLDTCELMARAGHDVALITPDDKDAPEAWRAGRPGNGPGTGNAGRRPPRIVKIRPSRPPLGLYDGATLAEQRPLIAESDVLHLHTPWDPANRQFAKLARQGHTPYVLTIHGMLDDWCMQQRAIKKRVYLAVAGRRLLEGAQFVTCTATAEQQQATKWFPRGTARVIPYVFDLAPFRELPGPERARTTWPAALAGGDPAVLFLSRLHYKKGPDVLIQAASLLKRRGVRFQLVFTGTGEADYEADLRRQAEVEGLADITTWTGLVVGDEKRSVYEAADVFALPTSQENFGLVFPESLACATPVIGTKGVDIWRELGQSGGAIIAERTPKAFADAIAELLGNPKRAKSMGQSGRRWVFDTFDGDGILEKYLSMYTHAAERMKATKGI